MAIRRNHLRVLPEERRNQVRLRSATEYNGLVTFSDNTEETALLFSPSNGTILVNLTKSITEKNVSKIQFGKFFSLECAEDWSIQEKRPGATGDTFLLVNKNKKYFDEFEDLVPPELFLHKSHYSVLNVENPVSLKELLSALTLVKDCSVPIDASVRSEQITVPVTLNFSANSSDLGKLDLEISEENSKQIKGRVFLDFNFLSVRYLLSVELGEFDKDFSLLTASVGQCHLAISGRIYDRYSCERKVTVVHETGAFDCLMTEISPEGGALSLASSQASHLLKFQTFYLDDCGARIPFRVKGSKSTSIESQILRISFLRDSTAANLELSKFFFQSLSGPSVVRKSEDYEPLLDLYCEVGYGPKVDLDFLGWKEKSKKVWANLDASMSGNCVLYLDSQKKAHVSVGVLPLSKTTIYSHSLASAQTLEGALGLSEQMILTQSWLSFLPDSEYYSGSYRKTSRLSTRLHASFSSGLKPQNQIIMHTHSWWNPMKTEANNEKYQFEVIESISEFLTDKISDSDKKLIYCLAETPKTDVMGHKIRYVFVKDKDETLVALAILHTYQDLTCATNFLNHSFLLPLTLDKSSTELNSHLVNFLKETEGQDSVCRASIVLGTGAIDATFQKLECAESQDYRSVFWTFTPREDLNCLNISLARASYNLCRKYGNDGVEAYAKTTLFN